MYSVCTQSFYSQLNGFQFMNDSPYRVRPLVQQTEFKFNKNGIVMVFPDL